MVSCLLQHGESLFGARSSSTDNGNRLNRECAMNVKAFGDLGCGDDPELQPANRLFHNIYERFMCM